MNELPLTLAEIPEYLLRFSPPTIAGHYDLNNMRRMMHFLGEPQEQLKVLHVAGTSGKTSTAYFTRDLLAARGQRVGLTVSPHVIDVRERAQVDGPLPPLQFRAALADFLGEVSSCEVNPTYFELLVAFAYWLFAREKVDYAVVEVGLGGLLDGTNVVERRDKVCLISTIGIDHTEILGNSLHEIADQKLGIIRPGNVVFIASQGEEMNEYLLRGALALGGEPQIVPSIEVTWLPNYQGGNLALAEAAVTYLSVRDQLPLPAEGAQVFFPPPGRFETIRRGGIDWILDGAHNPQKLAMLRQELGNRNWAPLPALVSFTAAPEHKLAEMVSQVLLLSDRVVITTFASGQDLKNKRSFTLSDMAAEFERQGAAVEVAANVPDGVGALVAMGEERVLVTGSLYLVSQVRERLLDPMPQS